MTCVRSPLRDRKELLATLLEPIAGERVRLVESFRAGGPALQQSACHMGLEGVVSKRRDSRYAEGRNDSCGQGQVQASWPRSS
jgi:bifunctional non-homologous end joining protein LigD